MLTTETLTFLRISNNYNRYNCTKIHNTSVGTYIHKHTKSYYAPIINFFVDNTFLFK